MAFDITKLERQSGGLQQKFSYQTADVIATVTAAGYFNAATDMLRQFDTIEVVSDTGATVAVAVDLLVVTSATGAAAVTTAALA